MTLDVLWLSNSRSRVHCCQDLCVSEYAQKRVCSSITV